MWGYRPAGIALGAVVPGGAVIEELFYCPGWGWMWGLLLWGEHWGVLPWGWVLCRGVMLSWGYGMLPGGGLQWGVVALGEASPFWGCFAMGALTPLPTAERGAGGGRRVAGGVPPGPAASAPRAGQRRRLASPPAGAAGGPRPCPPHHPDAPRPRLRPPPGAGGHRAGRGMGTPGTRGAQCPSAHRRRPTWPGGCRGCGCGR